MMVLPGAQPVVFNLPYFRQLVAEYGAAPEIDRLFGEAPDQASVVPGVESAGQLAPSKSQQNGRAAPTDQGNRMMERLIFSGAQQSESV